MNIRNSTNCLRVTPDEARQKVDTVIEVLKRRRNELGLSKRAVALRAGIDPKTITFLERGERNPTLVTLLLIASVLDCELGAILSAGKLGDRIYKR